MDKCKLKERLLTTDCFYDNEWLDKYVNLLFDNRLEKHIKKQSQAHHGFPKNLSNYLNEEIDDSKENIFELKFSLHVLAHIYLSMCVSNDELKRANVIAYKWMAGGRLSDILLEDLTFEDLEELQENYQDSILCGENHPMFGKKRPDLAKRNKENPVHLSGERNGMWGKTGELNPTYGRKHTEEERQKMSDSWDYDKHVTEQSRAKHKENERIAKENKTGWHSKESRQKAVATRIANGTNHLPDESREKISLARSRAVICLNTNVVYRNALKAEQETGLDRKRILKNCRGEIEYVQYHLKRKSRREPGYKYDDTHYVFSFYDEYLDK